MDAPPPPQPAGLNPKPKSRTEMTEEQRSEVYSMLLELKKGDELPRGAITQVAKHFSLDRSSISRLWTKTGAKREAGASVIQAVKSDRSLRKKSLKYVPEICAEQLELLPLSQRSTIRDTALALNIPASSFYQLMMNNQELFRVHNSKLKPTLTDENKLSRFTFVGEKIGQDGHFSDQYNEVHVDEKWFYLTSNRQHYILTTREDDPHRHTRHKGHIEKVMFLCAVARPRVDPVSEHIFSGKIGIWPVGRFRRALRSSQHRERGEMVWENLTMDRNLYRDMLMNKVLPAIKQKFPAQEGPIILQQDNAPAHVLPDDEQIAAKLVELDLNLKIVNQPANSPDTNINDLAFFRALQSMQLRTPSSNTTQLINAVTNAFRNYDFRKINHAFLTLQTVYNSILENEGGNQFKINHMNKERLEREGRLPVTIEVSDDAMLTWTRFNENINNDDDTDMNADTTNEEDN